MTRLFKIIFQKSQYRLLTALTLVTMCLLTFASQMEILTIGVITNRGPSVFEIFGSDTEAISHENWELKWDQLDPNQKGAITKQDVASYISQKENLNLVEWIQREGNRIFPIANSLYNLAIFILCVALFKAVTLFVHRYSTRLIAIRISRDLRQDYFAHIQSLPMSFYQQHNISSLSSRVVGDAALISEAVNACLVNYIQTPFTVLTTLILCFLTSWHLSLLVFIGFPLIVIPIISLAKQVKRLSKQIQQAQERFAAALIDFVSGVQTVKVFAMEDFSMKKYREHNQQMASLEQKSACYDLATRPIVHTIAMSFLATAILYGLYVLQMRVSDVLVFCGLLYIFYEPFKKFAEENTHIQRGISAAERMQEVLDIVPQIEDHRDAKAFTQFSETIEFDNVWFKYSDQWVLKGLSFAIRKGEKVAIVGPTGAGKSTIVQLLPRLYDIHKGSIRIDGQSIRSYTQKSLREMIAFVPQRPFLFLDTIAQNIAFGRAFSNEQICGAAQRAHAEEFILKLPEQYQTQLAEGGKNLSGGQQQRLAIARALIKDAPILVMDEATSSLDSVSEQNIKDALSALRGHVTQIIIAHRLSTIEDADRILYVERGEKVAEGTKDELLKSCPGFRQMWDLLHRTSVNLN